MLDTSIDADHSHPGQKLIAKIMQDVPLSDQSKLSAGTQVLGEVLAVTPASDNTPAMVAFRFNQLEENGHAIPISTNLRALASPLEVEQAQTQTSGDDRGSTPSWSQTVTQGGGRDVVYREEGKVVSGGEPIGKSVYAGNWGALSRVSISPDGDCRGTVAGNDKPQALWVFSHDACGVYGYPATTIKYAGRANEGRIVMASTNGDLKIRSGSGMLLRVTTANGPNNQSAGK